MKIRGSAQRRLRCMRCQPPGGGCPQIFTEGPKNGDTEQIQQLKQQLKPQLNEQLNVVEESSNATLTRLSLSIGNSLSLSIETGEIERQLLAAQSNDLWQAYSGEALQIF